MRDGPLRKKRHSVMLSQVSVVIKMLFMIAFEMVLIFTRFLIMSQFLKKQNPFNYSSQELKSFYVRYRLS